MEVVKQADQEVGRLSQGRDRVLYSEWYRFRNVQSARSAISKAFRFRQPDRGDKVS